MIEVGLFDIGSMTSMSWKELPGRRFIPDADLAEIQRHAQQLTLRQIERIVLADRLGFDYYWNSEHHFNIEGTELSPNPLQVQTAAAALTERIRLGQIAHSQPGRDPNRYFNFDAAPDELPIGLLDVPVTMRELSVLPQPLQKPHPPLWESIISPRSVAYAARQGFNGYFMMATVDQLREATELYYAEAEKAGWPDMLDRGAFRYGWDAERHRGVCCGRFVHVVEGGVGDKRRALRQAAIQWDWLKPFGFGAVFAKPGEIPNLDPELTPELLEESGLLVIGSRQEVLERLIELKEEVFRDGDAMLSLWMEAGCWSDEAVREQMQLVAEDILPELRRACGGGPERVPVLATDEEG